MAKNPFRREGSDRADDERDDHAQRHGQIHAHAPPTQVPPGTAEEGPTGKNQHGNANHPGSPAQQTLELHQQIAGLGVVGRPCVHHDLHHAKGGQQPAPQGLAVLCQPDLARHRITGRKSLVPRLLHRGHPLRRQHHGWAPHHAGTLGGGAHFGTLHARHGPQRIFDGQRAGRAVHAIQGDVRVPDLHILRHVGLARHGCQRLAKAVPFHWIVQQMEFTGNSRKVATGRHFFRFGSWPRMLLGHGARVSMNTLTHIDLHQDPTCGKNYAGNYPHDNLEISNVRTHSGRNRWIPPVRQGGQPRPVHRQDEPGHPHRPQGGAALSPQLPGRRRHCGSLGNQAH